MRDPSILLQSYVRGIRSLCGAGCVSLYVPGPLEDLSSDILLHDGDLEPIPELSTLEDAAAFLEKIGYPTSEAPLEIASTDPDCGIVPLPLLETQWSSEASATEHKERRRASFGATEAAIVGAWLGLRFPSGQGTISANLGHSPLRAVLQDQADPARWWDWLFALGGALAGHTIQVSRILQDPITGLPDRTGFQGVLAEELGKARDQDYPLTLLLVNPDDFLSVNELFGREKGDHCVHEISRRLRTVLRAADLVSRYGGVIFGVILVGSDAEEARDVGQRALEKLSGESYLEGALRLGFSIGLSVFEPSDTTVQGPLDLIRRADQALNAAKRMGGGRIVGWEEGSGAEELESFDRLSGIFTGNMSKDYRNMILLWDTVNVIAVNPDFDQLVRQAVDKLFATYKPHRVGIYALGLGDELSLLRGLTQSRRGDLGQGRLETLELSFEQQGLISQAVTDGVLWEGHYREPGPNRDAAEVSIDGWAIPLMNGKDCLGCIYVDWLADLAKIDRSDVVFLEALASQLAIAMDRARLTELDRRRQEWERRQLRAELNELRQALQQAKLVFRSEQMAEVVGMAHRVATTDATILITGPSGTGKELLARSIHELSPRSRKPLVIVDCGAIPATLIESELFGHEKGAYTGAQHRRVGRLAEANEGTVLLDEIGDLPLDVQSKLLRFVQEKQFTSVGDSKTREVDVRILAATNRDLAAEVTAGRFREDLYYRLNVIELEVPPLRERQEDILHLARHFLETFSFQYQKKIQGFTPAAEGLLIEHAWPGNVRELQNRILRAVILSQGHQLYPADLGFSGAEEVSRSVPLRAVSDLTDRSVAEPEEHASPDGLADEVNTAWRAQPVSGTPAVNLEEALERLRVSLRDEIESTLATAAPQFPPIGRWLKEDLLLVTDRAVDGALRPGAAWLGVPESTYRRRIGKVKERQADRGLTRSRTWRGVQREIEGIVALGCRMGGDLLKLTEQILLREIFDCCAGDVRTGAALLAVTAPTYRRRLATLESPTEARRQSPVASTS